MIEVDSLIHDGQNRLYVAPYTNIIKYCWCTGTATKWYINLVDTSFKKMSIFGPLWISSLK